MPELAPADITTRDVVAALTTGPVFRFADWPISDVPATSGIYTIWRGQQFTYVGVAGRQLATSARLNSLVGLRSRLNSRASGRRSGDQFCVYVCDRIVLARYADRLGDIADGRFSLDQATKDLIRSELSFRFAETGDYRMALELERRIKLDGLPGVGRPRLNP